MQDLLETEVQGKPVDLSWGLEDENKTKHVRVETRVVEVEGMASAKVPRQEHPWLVPGTDSRPVWLECNVQGGRGYERKTERDKEPDHIRKMLIQLC